MEYCYIQQFKPIGTIGYSINLYHFDSDTTVMRGNYELTDYLHAPRLYIDRGARSHCGYWDSNRNLSGPETVGLVPCGWSLS